MIIDPSPSNETTLLSRHACFNGIRASSASRTVHPHEDDTERPCSPIRWLSKFIPTGDELLRAKAQNGLTSFVESGIAQGVAALVHDGATRATPTARHVAL
jgi:hypothetical protein